MKADPEADEKSYTIYVDLDKVIKLNEIINQLPMIIKKHGNVSTSMNLIINEEKRKELDR